MTSRIVIVFTKSRKPLTPQHRKNLLTKLGEKAAMLGLSVETIRLEGENGEAVGQITLEELLDSL